MAVFSSISTRASHTGTLKESDLKVKTQSESETESESSPERPLVDHELLEWVEVCRDEWVDGLCIVVDELLTPALRPHGAGGPHQSRVGGAVALVERKTHRMARVHWMYIVKRHSQNTVRATIIRMIKQRAVTLNYSRAETTAVWPHPQLTCFLNMYIHV